MSSTRPESDPSDLSTIKERLRAALPRLREAYAVERLYVHGSRVRGEASPESDLDVLVDLGERSALGGAVGREIRREAQLI